MALGRWSWALAWSGLVALALALIQLLPTLEAASDTTRGALGMRSNLLAEFLFSMWGLIGPPPAGLLPTMSWEYRTGWTVLCLVTVGLAPVLVRGGLRFRLQAGVCLLLIVLGLGSAVPLQDLPGFRLFRIPVGMFLIVTLPLALLMGMVTQALSDALRPSNPGLSRTVWRLLAVVILFVGAGLDVRSDHASRVSQEPRPPGILGQPVAPATGRRVADLRGDISGMPIVAVDGPTLPDRLGRPAASGPLGNGVAAGGGPSPGTDLCPSLVCSALEGTERQP